MAVIIIVIAIVVYSSKRRPRKQFSRVFDGDRTSGTNEPRVSEGGGIGGHITAAGTWVQVDTQFRSSDVCNHPIFAEISTNNSYNSYNSDNSLKLEAEFTFRFVRAS